MRTKNPSYHPTMVASIKRLRHDGNMYGGQAWLARPTYHTQNIDQPFMLATNGVLLHILNIWYLARSGERARASALFKTRSGERARARALTKTTRASANILILHWPGAGDAKFASCALGQNVNKHYVIGAHLRHFA